MRTLLAVVTFCAILSVEHLIKADFSDTMVYTGMGFAFLLCLWKDYNDL